MPNSEYWLDLPVEGGPAVPEDGAADTVAGVFQPPPAPRLGPQEDHAPLTSQAEGVGVTEVAGGKRSLHEYLGLGCPAEEKSDGSRCVFL